MHAWRAGQPPVIPSSQQLAGTPQPRPALTKLIRWFCAERCVAWQEWRACKGSNENTRGYTCGLWMVLHSLAARASMAPHAGREYLDAVR